MTVTPSNKKASSVSWPLISLALCMLLSALGVSIVNIALPALSLHFSIPLSHVQWAVLAYLLTVTMMSVAVGRLGDQFGRRKILLIGILLFTTASFATAFASSIYGLIIGRGLQGIGAAALMVLSMSFVLDTVPKEKTGSAMGLLGTMSALGTCIAPSLGGWLIELWSWPLIFVVLAALGGISFLLVYAFLPRGACHSGQSEPFDALGAVLLALALGFYSLILSNGLSDLREYNVLLILAFMTCFGLFIFSQQKVRAPLLKLYLFKDLFFALGLFANLLVATVMMGTLVIGPFFLSIFLGMSEGKVGMLLSIGPFLAMLSGVPAGRLVDRFGDQAMLLAGLLGLSLGALLLSLLPLALGVPGFILSMALLTPNYQLFLAANNTYIMSKVSASEKGLASGVLSLSRNLGFITGASLMGALFVLTSNVSAISLATPEQVALGFRLTFLSSALVLAILSCVILCLQRRLKNHV